MSPGPYLKDTLKRRLVFFTGKGGVGKSSLAWATAVAARKHGLKVAVCGWNPYGESAPPVPIEDPHIQWIPLTTMGCFREYALHIVKFETIFDAVFDNPIIKTFLLAAPGLSETVIAGKIWDIWDHGDVDLILVDLPASGHAASFFKSPLGVQKVFSFGVVHKNTVKICDMFRAPSVRLDLVTLPEELPVTEALELKETLDGLHPFNWGFLHLNRCTPEMKVPVTRTGLPPEVTACLSFHESRLTEETEALSRAPRLKMPTTHLMRLASEERAETVFRLAEALEGA